MLVNEPDSGILAVINEKLLNYPGFFEGIRDAIQEFYIEDYITLARHWDNIGRFLKSYHINGMVVNQNGELMGTIFPFETDFHVQLALYVIFNYCS
jgi:hypothetical protein